ncbi:MAG: hypothetical protein GEV06_28990, partial [Luteitalea sp.]|nr:hypothetical protein [Luteitalea sp.]
GTAARLSGVGLVIPTTRCRRGVAAAGTGPGGAGALSDGDGRRRRTPCAAGGSSATTVIRSPCRGGNAARRAG